MGADITALLQIDDNSHKDDPPVTMEPSTWDLSHDYGLTSGKHYEFYAAISGVRNQSAIQPLFPCRGLPPRGTVDVLRHFDHQDPNVSWLTPSEIRQALQHMRVEVAALGRPVQMLLRAMEIAEAFYGSNRVRLVFQVQD